MILIFALGLSFNPLNRGRGVQTGIRLGAYTVTTASFNPLNRGRGVQTSC